MYGGNIGKMQMYRDAIIKFFEKSSPRALFLFVKMGGKYGYKLPGMQK